MLATVEAPIMDTLSTWDPKLMYLKPFPKEYLIRFVQSSTQSFASCDVGMIIQFEVSV
jgi:hypothetical protein